MKEKKYENKSFLLVVIAILVLTVAGILPLPEGLSREGMLSIGLIVAGIILWAGDVMPMGITAILLSAIMPWLGIIEFSDYYPNFATSIVFFMLATFAFTAALSTSTVPPRIVNFVLIVSKGKTSIFMLGILLGCGCLSSVMSNIPTCLLFIGLVVPLIKAENMIPGESRFAKCIMLGIPAASALGGFMIPSGSPINLLAIQFVEQMTGVRVSFLEWMFFGIPVGIVSIILVFICYRAYFKPEAITEKGIAAIQKAVDECGPMNTRDKKIVATILTILALWIASTWFPVLNTTMVALVGLTVFFLPGMRILSFKEYIDNVSFDVLFIIGGVNVIASGIVSTGAASWLVNTVMGNAASWPTVIVILVVSFIGCLLHNMIPAGPAVAALAIPPIIVVAMATGVSPIICVAIIAWWASITFLLPFDALPLLTYSAGYYSMGDMVKSGIVPTIFFMFALLVLWPFMTMLGY